MAKIFISHSSHDNAVASQIAAHLRGIGYEDRDIFLDYDAESGIVAGRSWERELQDNLRSARVVVCLISASWIKSDWCRAEYHTALLSGLTVFCIVVEECDHSAFFSSGQKLFLHRDGGSTFAKFERGLEVAGYHPTKQPFAYIPERGPYPGLRSFEVADAAVFFGRALEVEGVLTQLSSMRADRAKPRALLLLGASGSGKSSLMKAGVVARIANRTQEWIIIEPMRPGIAPLRALADALAATLRRVGDNRIDAAEIYASLAADPDGAWRRYEQHLRKAAMADDQIDAATFQPSILLPIDQFEEALRLGPNTERAPFARTIAAALSGANSTIVIGTMRSDFLPEYQRDAFAAVLSPHLIALPPVAGTEIAELIRRPAETAGMRLEEALVRRAAEDTGDGAGVPLLAFALEKLWRGSSEQEVITLRAYEAIGGIRGAIASAVERAQASVSATGETLRTVFVPRLVSVNDRGRPARRQALTTEFTGRERALVDALVDGRLLISSQTPGADTASLVEVAHERVLSAAPAISEAIADEQQNISLVQDLERQWDSTNELTPFELEQRIRSISGPVRERLRALEVRPEWRARLSGVSGTLDAHAQRYRWAGLVYAAGSITAVVVALLLSTILAPELSRPITFILAFMTALVAFWAAMSEGLLTGRSRGVLIAAALTSTLALALLGGTSASIAAQLGVGGVR